MKKNHVVLGVQWGDEGKGKLIDWMSNQVDVVVRFQGGHNAGHTLYYDNRSIVLRLLPSGILHETVSCCIAHGVVVSPKALCDEIDELKQFCGGPKASLRLSQSCPLLLPYHIAIDQAREKKRGQHAIGTTGRGIGPAYEDKVSRRGLRMSDLLRPDQLRSKIEALGDYHNFILKNYYNEKHISDSMVYDQLCHQSEQLIPLVCDVASYLHSQIHDNKKILFEGAQGTLLDIDTGTYPYVTSSNTTAGAASTGSGVGPMCIDQVIGVAKAYCTRVGNGPFPTEQENESGARMAELGHEFGSVTKRPRRCGWFDAVAMKHAIRVNSLNSLALMKLDILDSFETIFICVGYEHKGVRLDTYPSDVAVLEACTPIYVECQGWGERTRGLTDWDSLPVRAKNYIQRIEEICSVPIDIISTGPGRSDTIMRRLP